MYDYLIRLKKEKLLIKKYNSTLNKSSLVLVSLSTRLLDRVIFSNKWVLISLKVNKKKHMPTYILI